MNQKIRSWVFIFCFFLSGCEVFPIVPQPTITIYPTPTLTQVPNGNLSATSETGYQFTFDDNFIAEAHVKGEGKTCNGVQGPWMIHVQVTGSPEPGATIQTSGEAEFTLRVFEGTLMTQVEILTTGTGVFQTAEITGTGDIQDPLLFIFEIKPDRTTAVVTVTSTGKGLITLHTQDGDRTIPYATVFTTQPCSVAIMVEMW
ncbi:hypothetical protein [Anaerolinea thermophila]|uniref:hypothetical protein n=1 Tax=Anaerolinea thermophila TaxID=167964 RepID=UPI00059D4371|nr:hypothetical protein [Anaerolinea thermophila]